MHIRGKVYRVVSHDLAQSFANTYNQSQGSSAFSVDEEQSRDSGHDLNGTIAERRIQGLCSRVADILKDG